MNNRTSTESRRIEDYFRGRLSEEETRLFEIQMLEDDQLFAQVQREDLLRQGLAEQSQELSKPKPKPVHHVNGDGMVQRMRWLQPVLTGALALVVITLGVVSLDLRQQLDQMQTPQPGIPVITLHDQRAFLPGIQTQSSDFGDIKGPVLLEIDVSAYEKQEFQVEIQTTRDIYTYERVQPDARGYLTVYLPVESDSVAVYSKDGRILKRIQGN